MVAVTGFSAWSQGRPVQADFHGNNVAFSCLDCNAPVLATLMEHQRGSSAEKPKNCRHCESAYWLEAQSDRNRLLVHRVPTTASGRYVAGRAPRHSSGPNIASWKVVSALLAAYGGADYEELIAAVRQHDHPDDGKGSSITASEMNGFGAHECDHLVEMASERPNFKLHRTLDPVVCPLSRPAAGLKRR